MQAECAAEDVAQLPRPLAPGRAVDLDGVGQVSDLMREAELVLGGRGRELGREGVRAPHLGPSLAHEPVHHVCAAAERIAAFSLHPAIDVRGRTILSWPSSSALVLKPGADPTPKYDGLSA